jgi:hypothetical protein
MLNIQALVPDKKSRESNHFPLIIKINFHSQPTSLTFAAVLLSTLIIKP